MTQTITITKAQADLLKLVKSAHKKATRFVITVAGKPAAVLMSANEYEGWQETQEIKKDKKLMRELREAEADIKAGRFEDY